MNGGSRPRRGCFITLEGIEGVGKSTNVDFVAEQIRRAGRQVLVTREPGGVPLAERIRELLLATSMPAPGPMTELLLMFAARSAHIEELIEPALARGSWVVCDRFTDATYAYQGGGRGLPESAIASLESMVQRDLRPDLTLLLDADCDATRARRELRGARDRFEAEDREFLNRVRAAYLERARHEPGRFRIIDSAVAIDQVRAAIANTVTEFLSRQNK